MVAVRKEGEWKNRKMPVPQDVSALHEGLSKEMVKHDSENRQAAQPVNQRYFRRRRMGMIDNWSSAYRDQSGLGRTWNSVLFALMTAV